METSEREGGKEGEGDRKLLTRKGSESREWGREVEGEGRDDRTLLKSYKFHK